MTEEEFLKGRMPYWLEGEELRIIMPSNTDKTDVHSHLSKKYGYSWIYALRGYWWPHSHAMIYTGDYETPNMTIGVVKYLLNYFDDINWLGIGCDKGKPGEFWLPKVIIPRNAESIKDGLFKGVE